MAEKEPANEPRDARRRWSVVIVCLRYVLPAVVVLAGIVIMTLGGESELEGGAGIAGAGLAIYAVNWLVRASTEGDREREREEAARDYFDAHGRWPDEAVEAPRTARAGAPAAVASARLERRRPPRTRGQLHP